MKKVSGKFKDLTGRVYGRLTVIRFDTWYIRPKSNIRSPKWWCKCSCGIEKSISGSSLTSMATKSCGCIVKEAGFKISSYRSAPDGAFNDLWNTYNRSAKKRKLDFTKNKEYFKKLTSSKCYYCRDLPSNIRKSQSKYESETKDYIFNGVDRVDSKLGYIEGNVVPCCHTCNMMKRTQTYSEFMERIRKIYKVRVRKHLKN